MPEDCLVIVPWYSYRMVWQNLNILTFDLKQVINNWICIYYFPLDLM